MRIEEVRLKVNLKGEQYWEQGLILKHPIPYEILQEVKLNRGTVEVLKYADADTCPPPAAPIPEAKVKKLIPKRKVK